MLRGRTIVVGQGWAPGVGALGGMSEGAWSAKLSEFRIICGGVQLVMPLSSVIIIVWYDVGAHNWSGCAGVVGGGGR